MLNYRKCLFSHKRGYMSNIIINFTPTGMLPMKEITPFVPIHVAEIVQEVKNAIDLGITMVHLHARDETGIPTYKKEVYAEIIRGIRDYNKDIIIVVSTTGRSVNTFLNVVNREKKK